MYFPWMFELSGDYTLFVSIFRGSLAVIIIMINGRKKNTVIIIVSCVLIFRGHVTESSKRSPVRGKFQQATQVWSGDMKHTKWQQTTRLLLWNYDNDEDKSVVDSDIGILHADIRGNDWLMWDFARPAFFSTRSRLSESLDCKTRPQKTP